MPWNQSKCPQGAPEPFDKEDAKKAVESADFANSVFVNTSNTTQETRQAYTYLVTGGYRICIVGHIHVKNGKMTGPGKSFIPGWMDWDMDTPAQACQVIAALKDGGVFPGEARYPRKL